MQENETQIPQRFLRKKTPEERAAMLREKDAGEKIRQQAYLEKAKGLIRDFSEEIGRQPTFHVQNFGCQMNARDAEKLAGILTAAGFKEGGDESADFVIYNTCTVRDNADNHFFGRLGRASHYKKTNPRMKIAVCGCMMQEKSNVEKIRKSYPYVDLVFGTHNIFRFAEYLCEVYEEPDKKKRVIELWDSTDEIMEDLPQVRKYPYKSGVNIMFGCDNYCTYCIVPYVRGRERSREPEEILGEIRSLVSDGVSEIMLLGQNVNSYGKDLPEKTSFAQLLDACALVPGVKRLRFMTPHPKDFSEDVLDVIAEHPNIARHIHLPLQSGSTRILKAMNRSYTKEQYLALAQKIREKLPDCAITTDIIAGFPGEEAADADETIDVIEKVHFDNAYTFVYSPRKGTPAASWTPVPEERARDNFDRILAAVQKSAKAQTEKLTGKTMCGLAEEINSQDASLISCRLSNNVLVHVKGDPSMIGKYFDIHLDTCRNFYFFGTVIRENERGY